MKILVTGGAGYLGSVLLPKLVLRGHTVRVLEVGYFGLDHVRCLGSSVELIRGDLRKLGAGPLSDLLDDCDCVIHLAAISNDPSAELHPDLTRDINFQATVRLAEEARARRIRFLFSSSCSVYGVGEAELNECSPVHPLTVYAESKVNAEASLIQMADRNWRPVILRNGTLFGYSPRMRFDLVVNIFALYSALHNKIRVFGNGTQWRPFLHVGDCARAFIHLAEAPEPKHLVYNISHRNLRVLDIAAVFATLNPRINVVRLPDVNPDERDYRVSSARIREEGFQTRIEVASGAEEISEAIISGRLRDPESIFYRNAKWLKELTEVSANDQGHLVELMERFTAAKAAAL
jgi:nucleoside-diphosphate-sugar epimerase